MVDSAITCLLWQLGVIVAVCLALDVVVALRYDRKGRVRPNTVIRVPDRFLGIDISEAVEEAEEEECSEEYLEEEYSEEYPAEGDPQANP